MTEADQSIGTRWFEEIWNQKRREAIAEMMAPDAVFHEGGEDICGPEGFYPFFDRLQAAFSDLHITVSDTIAQGDKICVRWHCTMRHTGEGLGMAPTGKVLAATGISIMRIEGGMAREAWQCWDMLALLQQIGAAGRAATYMSFPA